MSELKLKQVADRAPLAQGNMSPAHSHKLSPGKSLRVATTGLRARRCTTRCCEKTTFDSTHWVRKLTITT